MPIRINLLAEAQAVEELRRRDPVKRAIFVALSLVVMVLVWISSLQVKIMADNSRLGNLQSRLSLRTNDYTQILDNKRKLTEANDKLTALNRLAANRFLHATLLDSLMHATVDGIQITKFRTDENVDTTLEVKPVLNEAGRMVANGKPATATEKIRLILDARDASPNPGDEQINKFKETLARTPYFESQKISTNNILLRNLSSPQLDNDSGKPYVLFTLECDYPDRTRGL
jgi:hypothetical protein